MIAAAFAAHETGLEKTPSRHASAEQGRREDNMFKAKDIMTARVVAVDVNDTVDRAIGLMIKHRISGLPVLDQQGCPVGIISEFDLLELICAGETEHDKVSYYMSPELWSVAEEDSWVTVADVFRTKRIRRLPVLRDGILVGIITRHDLMHAIRDARRQIRRELPQEARQRARKAVANPAPGALPREGRFRPESRKA